MRYAIKVAATSCAGQHPFIGMHVAYALGQPADDARRYVATSHDPARRVLFSSAAAALSYAERLVAARWPYTFVVEAQPELA